MRGRARGLHQMRWWSALAPSIVTAEPAKTAAPTSRLPSVASTKNAPTTQATTKPTACRTPRSRGLGRMPSIVAALSIVLLSVPVEAEEDELPQRRPRKTRSPSHCRIRRFLRNRRYDEQDQAAEAPAVPLRLAHRTRSKGERMSRRRWLTGAVFAA